MRHCGTPLRIRLADQRDAGPVGQVQVGRRVEHDEVGPRAGGEHPDVVAAQRPRAAGGRGPDRLGRGHPHLADGEGDAERHRRGVRRAGVAVGRQRDRRHRRRAAGGRPGTASGWRTPRRAAASPRSCPIAPASAVDVGVGGRWVQWSTRRRAELDAEPHARRRARAGWRAPAAPSPAACRRSACARASSTSKAPRSQNTSIHRACGAQAVPASGRRPGRRSRRGRRRTRRERRARRGTWSRR